MKPNLRIIELCLRYNHTETAKCELKKFKEKLQQLKRRWIYHMRVGGAAGLDAPEEIKNLCEFQGKVYIAIDEVVGEN